MTVIEPEYKMEPGEVEAKFKAEYRGELPLQPLR
jgi:hypothetical protein